MSSQDAAVDLESQIILRLPKMQAAILREGVRNAALSLKDRIRLRIEQDMRHGTLYLDNFVLPAKLVDLPCIIESHKTIDRKNIYKTADVAQMLICMEEEEPEEEPKPQKKKDNLKVDKKYLFPHGITPPLKNVRKRRFRRTLKKKQYSDQPEIEKEVRRLLRMDYEAHHVSWEVIDEEEDKTREGGGKDVLMQGSQTNEDPTPSRTSHRLAVEHIFGEALSDSDADEEDGGMITGGDLDDESRLSNDMDDSDHQSDSTSFSQDTESSKKNSSYVTTFSGDMFPAQSSSSAGHSRRSPEKSPRSSTAHRTSSSSAFSSMSKEELKDQLNLLKQQLTEISVKRQIQDAEMSSIDNMALRQRLEPVLDKLMREQVEKEREIQEVESALAQY